MIKPTMCCCVFLLTNALLFSDDVVVHARVMNEDSRPIENAKVEVVFESYQSANNAMVDEVTDSHGAATCKGAPAAGKPLASILMKVNADGYYESSINNLSYEKNLHEVDVVLRKVVSPIPLLAKQVSSKIPDLGKMCGYDLLIGDWVAPHGSGKVDDLRFLVNKVKSEAGDPGGQLVLSFAQGEAGYQKIDANSGYLMFSKMHLPHAMSGPTLIKTLERTEYGYHSTQTSYGCGYFFVVERALKPNDPKSRHYGKMMGDLEFSMGGGIFIPEEWRTGSPVEYAQVKFTYYLNPTPNDKNLEFDPKRNLFGNLPIEERVTDP